MKLQTSQATIPFTTTDIFGNSISLNDYQGKNLLLSFYRYAACPLCNLRIYQLIERYEALESQGLHTLAFFQSGAEKIRQYVIGDKEVPFPIIGDPDHKVYKLYGLEGSKIGYIRGALSRNMVKAMRLGLGGNDPEGIQNLHPADFLISPDQTIHTAYYGRDISDHIPFEQIDRFLNDNKHAS